MMIIGFFCRLSAAFRFALPGKEASRNGNHIPRDTTVFFLATIKYGVYIEKLKVWCRGGQN